MERERFLSRVRAAQRGAVFPDIAGPAVAPLISFADPVAMFVDSASAVAADVSRVQDADEVLEIVGRIMGDRCSVIGWDDLDTFVPGWGSAVIAKGWRRVDATVDIGSRASDNERVGAVGVGVTGADVAIAATGSVVLQHGPGRPRSASLLVEHHVVLLPANRIVSSLDEALATVDWEHSSNAVAITGPSRTGDIESILTLGVHGPRHVSIVVIG